MAIRIAINGFGRIGRTFLRALMQDKQAASQITIVAINEGPHASSQLDLLFKYDSVMGQFAGTVEHKNNRLAINNHEILLLAEQDAQNLPWKKLEIDWVLEASGCFTSHEKASKHIQAGCKKVLITAPSKDADVTIIPGVNDDAYDKTKHAIISMGSCTTNCFAPLVKIIKENFTLLSGSMTTIHAYTSDQRLLDNAHKDPRRARCAATNMIPTKTGAGDVITQIFPELKGKLNATAIRVPVPIVSLTDFSFVTKENITRDDINRAFEKAANGSLKNILTCSALPLVSSDFTGNSYSSIVDTLLTQANEHMGKVFAWYDNEFGYSVRLKEFLLHNQTKLL
ncbi:MAG: type I glyceraldehyde-3-phosphate dehydrogenase [bacterium]